MTFDEWLSKAAWKGRDIEECMREAWMAGQLVERDECAKACEQYAEGPQGWIAYDTPGARSTIEPMTCAMVIRSRKS